MREKISQMVKRYAVLLVFIALLGLNYISGLEPMLNRPLFFIILFILFFTKYGVIRNFSEKKNMYN